MLNRSASLAISTSVVKALPGKLDIKRHSPSILFVQRRDSNKECIFIHYIYAAFKITNAKISYSIIN